MIQFNVILFFQILIVWIGLAAMLSVIFTKLSEKISFIKIGKYRVYGMVAYYDFWIGVFVDRKGRRVYIFPLPMIGIMIEKDE